MSPDGTAVPPAVAGWHRVVEDRDPARISALLAPEVVFRSPAVHTPQEGSEKTLAYLTAAVEVLGPSLVYAREWYREDSAILEFSATLAGLSLHGIDLIAWDQRDRITEFTVMVRPLKGLGALVEAMGGALNRAGAPAPG